MGLQKELKCVKPKINVHSYKGITFKTTEYNIESILDDKSFLFFWNRKFKRYSILLHKAFEPFYKHSKYKGKSKTKYQKKVAVEVKV